jgi:hypothetical protein
LVIDAAQMYFLQEANLTETDVTIAELKTAGFLEKDYVGTETITKYKQKMVH